MINRNSICRVLPMLVVLALSACGGGATPSNLAGTAAQPGESITVTVAAYSPTPAAHTAALVQPPQTPTPVFVPDVLTQSDGEFRVELNTPAEVVVSQPEYTVSGRAPRETVITVNDDILMVDHDEHFAVNVPLRAGPNLIEVLASDLTGREVQFVLLATYQTVP